ncbi:MAG: hypothetical protein ACOX9E_09445 [Lentisphaeria bacterium]
MASREGAKVFIRRLRQIFVSCERVKVFIRRLRKLAQIFGSLSRKRRFAALPSHAAGFSPIGADYRRLGSCRRLIQQIFPPDTLIRPIRLIRP